MSSSMSPISADAHLQPIFDRAVEHHQNQDFSEARRLYTKLWNEVDHAPSARHLAILNVQESNWKEALELYESLMRMGSSSMPKTAATPRSSRCALGPTIGLSLGGTRPSKFNPIISIPIVTQ